jgi:hypothetical protein
MVRSTTLDADARRTGWERGFFRVDVCLQVLPGSNATAMHERGRDVSVNDFMPACPRKAGPTTP